MNAVSAELLRKYAIPGPRYTSYPTVPCWDRTPTESQWLEHVANALDADGGRSGASLYVHIPFCRALCTFCGCNMRVTRNRGLISPYVRAVLAEYALYLQRLDRDRLPLGEIHLGGGTPTYLDAGELDGLLQGLLARASILPGASLSLEVDPRVTHRTQLEVLRHHGFNRISLGVQDFDPQVQDIVNRVQSEAQVREVVATARALGFGSINFDLIYGLPLQTLDSIRATMQAVVRLRPDRIAFYAYAHVPWIKPSQRRFTELDLPEGDARRALYELGREMLEAAGYREIGMDHFALPDDLLFQAATSGALHRNFMGYAPARTNPLLGLGVSAIGDAGDAFVQNEKNLQQYEERVLRGELPIQRGHLLNEEDRVIRAHILNLMTRLETHWSSPVQYTPFLDGVIERLRELRSDRLVETAERQVRVTETGRAFLRNVCMAFDARLMRQGQASRLFSRTV